MRPMAYYRGSSAARLRSVVVDPGRPSHKSALSEPDLKRRHRPTAFRVQLTAVARAGGISAPSSSVGGNLQTAGVTIGQVRDRARFAPVRGNIPQALSIP